MPTSVATIRYGSYTFSPVPQYGIRDSIKRIGETALGNGNRERQVSFKGKLYGVNFNDVQTQVWNLEAALALDGQTLYLHDGTAVRINEIAKPDGIEIPEDWGQYEVDYTVRFKYLPLGNSHYDPVSVNYNGYVFSPIPALGRE